ncbi:hypothetical protein, partial [Leuconostoc mesenteroides]|uniref:hypothetical protein n=1 Tax=Leuconostoc mesenteroides TaxID=1245 RepID=UPI001C92FE50
QLTYKPKNISQLLNITPSHPLQFFTPIPKIPKNLQTINHLPFPYLKLPQSPTTFSPPQPQPIKLPSQLHPPTNPKTIY